MPSRRTFTSIVRPVVNKQWVTERFLPDFLAFATKPANRDMRVNLRSHIDIQLLPRQEVPRKITASNLGHLLLKDISVQSRAIRTTNSQLLRGKHGLLNLTVMLEYDPRLKEDFRKVRQNLAQITNCDDVAEAPPTAYGIILARCNSESLQDSQRLSLIELAEVARPQYVVLDEPQVVYSYS